MKREAVFKITDAKKKKFQIEVKKLGLSEKINKINAIMEQDLSFTDYTNELKNVASLEEINVVANLAEVELEIENEHSKLLGMVYYTLRNRYNISIILREFQKAIRNIIKATKSILNLFQQKTIDTFTPPQKLFTQTITHYTHTLSRP